MDTLTKPKVKIRIKKPSDGGGSSGEIIKPSTPPDPAPAPHPFDISIILKHNKKYKPVLKQLLRKTAWFQWLHQFDIVMAEYKERAVEYFEYKEQKVVAATAAPSSPIITPLMIPKNSVVIIKKKKKT